MSVRPTGRSSATSSPWKRSTVCSPVSATTPTASRSMTAPIGCNACASAAGDIRKERPMASAKSKMNVWQLTILSAVNMMGSGIILLPAKLAEVGTISIFSWLITAGGSLALAYAFARCGMLSKKPGGMGGYAEYAFGKAGNYMANYTYGLSLVIANVAIAITAVGYGTVLFNVTLSPIQTCIWTIVLLVITTVANFGGARITGRIGAITVWGVIVPVVVVSIIGWFWF